jgi:hypothetical protein
MADPRPVRAGPEAAAELLLHPRFLLAERRAPAEPKAPRLPQIEAMPITLKYIPHDLKPCDCLQNALMRVPNLRKVSVAPTQATMMFTGDWDQLVAITNAAASVRIKSALYSPAMFSIDYVVERQSSVRAVDVAAKIPGVAKAFGGDGKLYVFGPVAQVDPRAFAPALKEEGIKFLALRSHRLRTLSYEPWEKGIRPERIRERLMKVPGVLRVDMDPVALTATVLMIRDSIKDLELVGAAEEVNVTLFPGTAEDEEPLPENPPTPTQSK